MSRTKMCLIGPAGFILVCFASQLLSMDLNNSVSIVAYEKKRDFEVIKQISVEGADDGIQYACSSLSLGAVKVARLNGMTVGFINYLMEDARVFGFEYPYIAYFGVAARMRGQGIGRQLLTYAMHDIMSHGFNRIDLKVCRKSERAIRLYTSMGFVEDPVRGQDFMEMVCQSRMHNK